MLQISASEESPSRDLEPYLQSRVVDDTALISWKEGPRTGDVYDSVRLDDCNFSDTPSIEGLEEQIIERFIEHRAGNIDPGSYESNERQRVSQAIGEAIATLYTAYYGNSSAGNGIELAQMFDLDGEGEKYNVLANKVIGDGRRTYLGKLGLRYAMKGLDISYGNSMIGIDTVSRLCFAGDGDLDEYSSMALTHSTVTDITPAIIQMKAITSDDVRAEAGLSKMSGETKRGEAHGSEDVFFWPDTTITRTNPFGRAFDPDAGLELPAVWGIKDTRPLQNAGIQIKDGYWQNEKRIGRKVPLEFFTNLWVPPMAMAHHAQLLTAHGFGHIQVSPFPSRFLS